MEWHHHLPEKSSPEDSSPEDSSPEDSSPEDSSHNHNLRQIILTLLNQQNERGKQTMDRESIEQMSEKELSTVYNSLIAEKQEAYELFMRSHKIIPLILPACTIKIDGETIVGHDALQLFQDSTPEPFCVKVNNMIYDIKAYTRINTNECMFIAGDKNITIHSDSASAERFFNQMDKCTHLRDGDEVQLTAGGKDAYTKDPEKKANMEYTDSMILLQKTIQNDNPGLNVWKVRVKNKTYTCMYHEQNLGRISSQFCRAFRDIFMHTLPTPP